MPIISANGADFYYELLGTGKPLILIAGYTCDYSSWQTIAKALSKHFQVLVFDNRAIGRTKDNNGTLSIELMAKDVVAIADQLHLEKPHIAGQSMGGTIAQTIAALYPDKINKLCLLTTSSKWRQAMLRGFKSLLKMRERNIDFDFIFECSLPWVFGDIILNNETFISAYKKLILKNPYPQSLSDQTRQFNVLETFDGRDQLKNIKAPTLVVYGRQDLVSLPKESAYIAEQIPNAKLVEVDCAHNIMLEVPKQLAETMLQFLNA